MSASMLMTLQQRAPTPGLHYCLAQRHQGHAGCAIRQSGTQAPPGVAPQAAHCRVAVTDTSQRRTSSGQQGGQHLCSSCSCLPACLAGNSMRWLLSETRASRPLRDPADTAVLPKVAQSGQKDSERANPSPDEGPVTLGSRAVQIINIRGASHHLHVQPGGLMRCQAMTSAAESKQLATRAAACQQH